MILYQIKGNGVTRFEGSRVRANKVRAELVDTNGGKKNDYSVDEAEVSTKKAELIWFLNALCETKESEI